MCDQNCWILNFYIVTKAGLNVDFWFFVFWILSIDFRILNFSVVVKTILGFGFWMMNFAKLWFNSWASLPVSLELRTLSSFSAMVKAMKAMQVPSKAMKVTKKKPPGKIAKAMKAMKAYFHMDCFKNQYG